MASRRSELLGVGALAAAAVTGYIAWELMFGESPEGPGFRPPKSEADDEDDKYLGEPQRPTPLELPENASVVGLQNNGNTCFLNSILQALSSLRAFHEYLHDLLTLAPNLELARELLIVVQGGTSDAIKVHRIIASRERMYSGTDQQDAHELLTSLLSAIDADARRLMRKLGRIPVKSLAGQEIKKDDDAGEGDELRCPPLPLLGATATTKECQEEKCGYSAPVRHTTFWSLGLSLAGGVGGSREKSEEPLRLMSLLRTYNRAEKLPKVTCERCTAEAELEMVNKVNKRARANPNSRWSHPRALAKVALKKKELERFLETGIESSLLPQDALGETRARGPPELPWAAYRPPSMAKLDVTAKCEVVKRELLLKLPPVLCLHLQRRYGAHKISDFVQFDLFIDLASIVLPAQKHLKERVPDEAIPVPDDVPSKDESTTFTYALCAVVEHKGGARSGHYVTYRREAILRKAQKTEGLAEDDLRLETERNKDKVSRSKWYRVSDSSVVEVELKDVLQSQAYLLFYERLYLRADD